MEPGGSADGRNGADDQTTARDRLSTCRTETVPAIFLSDPTGRCPARPDTIHFHRTERPLAGVSSAGRLFIGEIYVII